MDTLEMIQTSNLIPESMSQRWFIAGGYAADPELASDCDVFVTTDDFDRDGWAIERHLEMHGFTFKLNVGMYFGPPALYVDGEFPIMHVAIVTAWRGLSFPKPVQLLLTDGTWDDVIGSFDISTHQIARLHSGEMKRGSDWTPVTEVPVILRDMAQTPARYVKIENRYRHLRESTIG